MIVRNREKQSSHQSFPRNTMVYNPRRRIRLIDSLFFFCLLLCSSIEAAVEQTSTPEAVSDGTTMKPPSAKDLLPIQLDGTIFDKEVSDKSIWLIEFYAPWCSHCSTFAPTYMELAQHFHKQNFEKDDRKIKVAKVNGDSERALTTRFGVYGFPSFYLVDGWSVYEFDGHRSFSALRDWVDGGYKQQSPLPIWQSPFGPLGMLQACALRLGWQIADWFSVLQESYGLSQLLAATVLFGSFFVASFMMIVLLAMTIKTKVD